LHWNSQTSYESIWSSSSENKPTSVEHALSLNPPGFLHSLYTNIDLVGMVATRISPVINWILKTGDKPRMTRKLLEWILDIDHRADLPVFVPLSETYQKKASRFPLHANPQGPSFGKRKAVLYCNCLVNYSKPSIGSAARAILSHTGVEITSFYPGCCGMPQLEAGNIRDVSERLKKIASSMKGYIEKGYSVITLIPSCSLMLKQESQSILPDDPDIKLLASHTFDITEYVVDIAKKEGLIGGMNPIDSSVTLHHSCHARAQNRGFKAKEMLALIPKIRLSTIERCSGHGGSFGVKKVLIICGILTLFSSMETNKTR